MSILKRLSATFFSRVDQVVGEIENHDAVIQASLNEMSRKIANAKVELRQADREKTRLKDQLEEQQSNVQRWRDRATECAKSDEDKALECLRRSHHCQTHAERLEKTLAEYEQTTETMADNIKAGEQHLAEMKRKLTLMRARQATGKVNSVIHASDDNLEKVLDDTFDRWEINISHAEISFNHVDELDPIEREFISKEQKNDLRDELAELLAKEQQK